MDETDHNPVPGPPSTPPPTATEPPAGPVAKIVPAPVPPPVAPAPANADFQNKKLVAGLLGVLVGGLGIHKFYLGYQQEGIIMLLVTVLGGWIGKHTCFTAPLVAVMPIIGLIEGILYLTKSDQEFMATYVTGRKPWF